MFCVKGNVEGEEFGIKSELIIAIPLYIEPLIIKKIRLVIGFTIIRNNY